MSATTDNLDERLFVGAALDAPVLAYGAAIKLGLKADDFESPKWSSVFVALCQVVASGLKLDDQRAGERIADEAIRVAKELGEKLSFKELSSAASMREEGSEEDYVSAIIEDSRRRRVGTALTRGVRSLASSGADTDGVVKSVVAEVASVVGTSRGTNDIGSVVRKNLVLFEEARNARMEHRDFAYSLQTPWPKFNGLFGGFDAGLHVIGARPSVGKTAFFLNLARYWCEAQKKRVLFDCLDMAPELVMKRPVVEESTVPLWILQKGFANDLEIAAARDATAAVAKWPIIPYQERDFERLAAVARMEKAARGLDAICIDYIQCLGTKYGASINDKLEHIAYGLKELGNTLGIPVIALSQLNRGSAKEQREADISDLRGSGGIEQSAETVTLLSNGTEGIINAGFRKVRVTDGAKDVCEVKARVAKSQNGGTGKMSFIFFKPIFRFMLAGGDGADDADRVSADVAGFRQDRMLENLKQEGVIDV